MSQLTVKSHRPVQWTATIIVLSMLIALITWLLLDESHWAVIYGRMNIADDFKRLGQVNRELEQENNRLNEVVMMMERTASLDKETALLLQQEVQSMQDEIYRLKGELEFYRGIMDATSGSDGLNIQGIHIESLSREHNYRLKLVLTHVAKVGKLATGTVEVSIEGLRNGVSNHLKLQDIALDNTLDLSFRFRNFKRFESDLELPAGFTPRKVMVQLQLNGEKQSKIKRVFDWSVNDSGEKSDVG